MRRPLTLLIVGILGAAVTARAEHARITLDVSTPREKQTAHMDQTPPDSGKNPRPVLRAKVGEAIKVQYVLTNIYPHKTLEGAVVHFFIAPEAKVGQKDLPEIGEDVVLETAFDLDFAPGAKAGARSTLTIRKAGVYLVRVETLKTGSDHEHFAAIDLVVEDE